MTGSLRRLALPDRGTALALPERRPPRLLLVPEVLPDEPRGGVMPDDAEVDVSLLVVSRRAYGAPVPPPGLLVDVYG